MRTPLGLMYAAVMWAGCGGFVAPSVEERAPDCTGIKCPECAPVAARVIVRDAFTGGGVAGVSVEGLAMTCTLGATSTTCESAPREWTGQVPVIIRAPGFQSQTIRLSVAQTVAPLSTEPSAGSCCGCPFFPGVEVQLQRD